MMSDEFKPIHGFYLNVADGAGTPGSFRLPVFPESVLDVEAKPGGGSSITVRMSSGDSVTLDVAQPIDLVQELMRRCKELDERAASIEGPET